MIVWAAVAGVGWGVATLFIGLWLGERRARRWMENMHFFGTPDALKKARVSVPEDPEDRVEEAIDKVIGVTANGRKVRVVRAEDSQPEFDERTIQNGVDFLLEEARRNGIPLSEDEARDDAIKMLGAQGTEI